MLYRNFWALPAILRLALCTQVAFSVQNDLLAFPQYDIQYSSSFISASEAEALLAQQKSSSATSDVPVDGTPEYMSDLSIHLNGHDRGHDYGAAETDPTSYDVTRDTHERMVSGTRQYLCTIPYVKPPMSGNNASANNNIFSQSAEEERKAELVRATEHGMELLRDMQGKCIYYNAGWWVYSFCYNEAIMQFHPLPPGKGGAPNFPPTPDPTVHRYLLGRFPGQGKNKDQDTQQVAEASTSSLQTAGAATYLVQRLDGGTSCDLTGLDRRIEVQFHCNPSKPDQIHMIKETSSCVYLMVIHTPRLCNDVAFLPPQTEKPHTIACREIIGSAEEERDWRARTAAVARGAMCSAGQELDEQCQAPTDTSKAEQPRPLVIGGVTVGGRQLVGSNADNLISATDIISNTSPQRQMNAGGSKGSSADNEKHLATLAKFDGKYVTRLSDAEMKKLGFKVTAEELAEWMKQMQDRAGEGTPWQLDVMQLEDGRILFTGIVIPHGTDSGKKAKKAASKNADQKGEAAPQRQEPGDDVNHQDGPNEGGDYDDDYGDLKEEQDEGSQEEFK